MIQAWVAFWDRREPADSLALVRVLLAALILVDLGRVLQLDLVATLYAPREAGGLGDPLDRAAIPELYRWFPATVGTARAAVLGAVAAAALLGLGLGTRLAALALLLLLAQLALIVPASDRGIDMLLRNALLVLALGPSGAAWSLDARLRTGRWRGDGAPRPAWARTLLVAQLVVLYFMAGVQKVSSAWLPPDWSALWIAMADPHFGRDLPLPEALLWPLSRLGTALTWTWEWSAPLLLPLLFWRATAERPGRLRALCNRARLLEAWIGLGAFFHLGTHLALRLGIFPFAVLALYPAFVSPSAWSALAEGLAGLGRRRLAPPPL